MSYGARLYNANGDIALDLENVLTLGESGTARSIITLESEAQAKHTSDGASSSYLNAWNPSGTVGQWNLTTNPDHAWDEAFVATASTGLYTEVLGGSYAYPYLPPDYHYLDMVFVDISTKGLVASLHNTYDFSDGNGRHSVHYLFTEDGTAPNYTRARAVVDNSGVTETHGMQLFDASGNVIFDSRVDLFTIFDSFFVSQADVQDVLENDATYTYTLSKSASGAKVCAPFFGPFWQDKRTFSDYTYACRLKQTAADTITLDRVQEVGGRSYSADYAFYHSFSFFVGR